MYARLLTYESYTPISLLSYSFHPSVISFAYRCVGIGLWRAGVFASAGLLGPGVHAGFLFWLNNRLDKLIHHTYCCMYIYGRDFRRGKHEYKRLMSSSSHRECYYIAFFSTG
ncbi:hypothetical protein BJX66DRAFT_44528 [Aspergillus keveii]|uniref:Uncharacterized protein n=1 Tax=Aspergillus keveii TaxID=714993 RepID=A0ABR4GH16_9EURO